MNMKNHYATQHILTSIISQPNDYFLLYENISSFKGTPYKEPSPAWDITNEDTLTIINRLNDIFSNPKAQIIMEFNTGFDDEGGNLYEAYLLKPEHYEHYGTFMEEASRNQTHYSFSIIQYISLYPENLISVWAGPY